MRPKCLLLQIHYANPNAASIPDNVRYVLDGGALLHRIPWSRGASFESILETYSKYAATNYGKAVIVFDGYKEFTTKDMTHKRRLKGKQVAQGQYVVRDTRCPAVHDCKFE